MESKGHRKVSDSDMDNIKRATEHRLRFKKQGNMNNQKQLPQELVEKYEFILDSNSVSHVFDSPTDYAIFTSVDEDDFKSVSEQCARIAVDYAKPFKDEIQLFTNELEKIVNSVDNRINQLKQHANEYMSEGNNDGFKKKRSEYRQLEIVIKPFKQLLKKQEDGK